MGLVKLLVGAVSGIFLILLAIYIIPLLTISDSGYTGDEALIAPTPPTSYSPTLAQKKKILDVEKTYSVLRGKNSSFEISVSNPFKNSTIMGLDLTIDGSFAKHLSVNAMERTDMYGEEIELSSSPSEVGLDYGETQKYKITADIPQYVERGTYFVNLEIHKGNVTYRDYPAITTGAVEEVLKYKDVTFEIIESRTIGVSVHTYSVDEAGAVYEQSVKNIGILRSAGFSTKRVERLLESQLAQMSDGDYEEAIEIGEEINTITEDAFMANAEIGGLLQLIENTKEMKGLVVPETRELLGLSVAAFERGDYETALARVNDANLVYSSEIRGKVNYTKILLDNLTAVIIGIGAIIAFGALSFNIAKAKVVGRQLGNLEAREASLVRLLKDAQDGYYVNKTMGTKAYEVILKGYTEKIAEIRSNRAKLRVRRASLADLNEEIESLKEERKNLEKLIIDAQDRYYNKKAIGRREYNEMVEHYMETQAEVEGAISLIEARLEK